MGNDRIWKGFTDTEPFEYGHYLYRCGQRGTVSDVEKNEGRDLRGIVFDHANGSDGSGFNGADLLHTDALDLRALAAAVS